MGCQLSLCWRAISEPDVKIFGSINITVIIFIVIVIMRMGEDRLSKQFITRYLIRKKENKRQTKTT